MRIKDLIFDCEISRMDTIKRWDLNQIIKEETITSHSYWVTFFANVLAEALTKETELKLLIIRYAIIHDFEEIFSGDINHIVKRNKFNGEELTRLLNLFTDYEMKNKFKHSESKKIFIDLFDNEFGKKNESMVKKIVKLCDWISFFRFLLNEYKLGNRTLVNELKYCSKNIIDTCRFLQNKLQDESVYVVIDISDSVNEFLNNFDNGNV